ncbi:ribosome-associated protein [Luteibacter sp. UNCMF331Sha3.1]|uniref:RNA-binding S4 domain-containing protein n=1 Tax=Luteibacter sp. UNCMF331Sha3.1 TaxID=1502760 RepID=UPI0008CD6502|nr:RNA-binding S4 domain-containing protein [Luteibacter sp. UNCMF331Sha3.1]SEN33476.1 ribosome-associated protein [Luteibacter sp. UNCMF331Sha3.1]
MSFHEFRLEGDYVELNLLLKLTGIASSGGEGKHMVADGLVTVDGVQELRKTFKVRAGQVVRIGDEEISVLPEVD